MMTDETTRGLGELTQVEIRDEQACFIMVYHMVVQKENLLGFYRALSEKTIICILH